MDENQRLKKENQDAAQASQSKQAKLYQDNRAIKQ